jgi:hypothetical protein
MVRKYDPGYSFRASETFRRETERGKPHQADDEGKHDCALGSWCHAATRDDDGNWHPALTFQAFCSACRGRVATCLDELPFACVRMLVQIGQRPRTGKAVRVPPGPREPIRLEVDALVREMAAVLGSWHERVADVARLSAPDMEAASRHPVEAVRDAAKVLGAHLDALLALPAEPMVRVFYSPKAAQEQAEGRDSSKPWSAPGEDGRVTRSGEAYLLPSLSGEHAGREILDLHHRARKVTGETKARPESFDGVPCRTCEAMSLERAEPPSDPKRPAGHSRCAGCGDTMDRKTYDEWVGYYQGWAKSAAGLACRRCQNGDHEICKWDACACRASGHAGSAAA